MGILRAIRFTGHRTGQSMLADYCNSSARDFALVTDVAVSFSNSTERR
jgi:hypothetical protein